MDENMGEGKIMINTGSINITPAFLSLIAEIDEFKGAWRALGTLAPDRLGVLRHIATIESIGSSTRIEGSQLSDREVELLLSNVTIKKFSSRDAQEVAGYAEVIETLFSAWPEISITENHIKQLHRDLLRYSDKDERHRGEYKTLRNDVGAFDEKGQMIGVVFETATPFDTPQKMKELMEWYNKIQELKLLHPLLAIGIFIVIFLEIHPFQDGNGRLSRILTNLLLLKAGYAYVSYSSLENVVELNKEQYYLALRQTQKTIRTSSPDWQPWLQFFLKALQQQKRRLAEKVENEKLMMAAMSQLSAQIMGAVQKHGRITMSNSIRLTGASRNTLKEHFKRLVEEGHLTKKGEGKGTWYCLP
jgi:Fic family protein